MEVRLIDADAIRVRPEYMENVCGIVVIRVEDLVRILNEQPTIPKNEELLRCAECKHLFDGEHTENCCDVLMEKTGWLKEISVSPDWFCADGRKR